MLYDPYSRAIQEDPFPTYHYFLENEPCTYNPSMDFYALFRFEDVWDATLDWKTHSSSLGPALENRGQIPGELFSIIGMDPPAHTRLRNLVSRGFTPKRIAGLAEEVRRLAAHYLDPLAGIERFDVQQSFAVKLPMDVISVLLGIPEADRDWYRHTVDKGLERDPDTGHPSVENLGMLGKSRTYLLELLAERRKQPREDLISVIADAEYADPDGRTRRLSDVTRSLPDVVQIARCDLARGPFILDGEVVALDAGGRPLAFQELMRRFRRVHGVEALVREMPLALHFFDCLMADGCSLIDEPYARRWDALTAVTGGRYLAERRLVTTADEAAAFRDAALAAGHEGVMAKDLQSAYEPGGRGKRWFKVKAAETIDCVIVAVDRGSGRRQGWLSNYHLAVRDAEGFADVGKTFKGFTDAQFVAMTERLWTLATDDDGYTVRVRPEVVVEVEYNEIQKSPTYRSGLALRFARIARVREDKAPGQATTLEELRGLYERQFRTKGRAASVV